MAGSSNISAARSNRIASVTLNPSLSTAELRVADVVSVCGDRARWHVPVASGTAFQIVDGTIELAALPRLPLVTLLVEFGRILDLLCWYRSPGRLPREMSDLVSTDIPF